MSQEKLVPPFLQASVIQTVTNIISQQNNYAKLLNLYLWGSRLNGTHDPRTSDWDFVAIVCGYEQPELTQAFEAVATTNDPQYRDLVKEYEVSIYDKRYFQWLIDKHVPWALPLLFHPPEATLKLDHTFNFSLVVPLLLRAVQLNTTVNLQQAKMNFAERGERRRSMKRIFHVMQMNIWATQIASHGRIVDRDVGNQYYFEMQDFLAKNSQQFDATEARKHWRFFEDCWKPIMTQLESELFTSATRYLQFELDFALKYGAEAELPIKTRDIHPVGAPLCVIEYLNQHGMEQLVRNFAISVTSHPEYTDRIYHLRFNRETSPLDSRVTLECNSLIVEKCCNDNIVSYRAVAFPFHRFYSHTHTEVAQIDWKSTDGIQLREWVDGRLCILYFFDGRWNIASSRCPAARNSLLDGSTVADSFWKVFQAQGYTIPLETNTCFMFELVLRDDPLVMHYPEDRLVFLASRNMETLQELDFLTIANRYGWKIPLLRTGDEILNHKKEALKLKKGPPPPKSGPPPVYLNVDDILDVASESWSSVAGYVVQSRVSSNLVSPVRFNVRSPLTQRLLQLRFSSKNQQESIMLNLLSMYSFYNHPALQKCPFKPTEDSESNCCDVFNYVTQKFNNLCDEVDEGVKKITDAVGDSKKDFSAKAEADYRDIAVR